MKVKELKKIKLDQIGLCMGCGLCEAISKDKTSQMTLNEDGFLHPGILSSDDEKIIDSICPGKNIVTEKSPENYHKIWGNILNVYSAYSTDDKVRKLSSSGGVVSGLAIHMLEEKIVDAILQVGSDANNYENNELKISKTKKDVLACSSSRYAPANVFGKIVEILGSSNDSFCFIGKPCDISALANLLKEFPEFKNRFKYTIAIFCAGIPSFIGTKKLIESQNAQLPVNSLRYRGNGWPGSFSFNDKTNTEFKINYNDSWGNVLGRHLNLRCKICPDGIGLQADIAVGDAWDTKDGYPDFKEKDGKSFIICRTKNGKELVDDCQQKSKIELQELKTERLETMQPYQFQRRKVVGARLLAFQLRNRTKLNFKNLSLISNSFKITPLTFYREFMGTFRRAQQNN